MNIIKKLIQRWKNHRHVDLEGQDFSVELKPFLGMKPELYLRLIFSFVVILILFLTLILPGIRNNGSIVSITSTPDHSAVYINGDYKGMTPLKVFVPKGNARFRLIYTGCAENLTEVKIGGRIFFSKIFPRRKKIELSCKTENPVATAEASVERFTELTCFHSFEEGTRPPRLLTMAAARIIESDDSEARTAAWNRLLNPALTLANTSDLKEDAFNALLLASSDRFGLGETGSSIDPALTASDYLLNPLQERHPPSRLRGGR